MLLILLFASIFAVACVVALLVAMVLEQPGPGEPAVDEPAAILKSEQLSSISIWDSLLAKFDFVNIMKTRIAEAALGWSVGRLTMSMLLSGAIALAVLSRIRSAPTSAMLITGAFATLLPYLYVLQRRNRRFNTFAAQFPDALDSLGRALRAGHPLLAALDLVSREVAPPVSSEIRKIYTETNLGLPLAGALENLRERIPIDEVDLFATAVQLHSRTGGRLTDLMGALAANMREQVALRGEVRALAAHGRITGTVLTVIPIAIAVIMMIVNPTYIAVLVEHPYGKPMIAAAILCLISAHFVMRKIVDISI